MDERFDWAVSAVPTAPAARYVPVAPPPALMTRTRWRKTPTTFGPLGRVIATVAVALPLPLMVVGGLADPFIWGGAALWLVIVMPWALRDVWKAGQIPVG